MSFERSAVEEPANSPGRPPNLAGQGFVTGRSAGAAASIEMVADQDLGQAHLRRLYGRIVPDGVEPHIARIARLTGNRDRSLGRHPSGGHFGRSFPVQARKGVIRERAKLRQGAKMQRLTYDRFSGKDELVRVSSVPASCRPRARRSGAFLRFWGYQSPRFDLARRDRTISHHPLDKVTKVLKLICLLNASHCFCWLIANDRFRDPGPCCAVPNLPFSSSRVFPS